MFSDFNVASYSLSTFLDLATNLNNVNLHSNNNNTNTLIMEDNINFYDISIRQMLYIIFL